MFDVITIGGATRDITFITDKGRIVETPENLTEQRLLGFEYGAKIRSEEVYMNFGGGACNAAATLANMGLDVSACVRVGEDENGKAILDNMKSRGVNIDLSQKDQNQNSGFSFLVIGGIDKGEKVAFVHKGASNGLEIHNEEIKNAKWIYLTSLCGDFESALEKIAAVVKESGIKLLWNPGETEIGAGKEKIAGLLALTSVLVINKDEAIELIQSDKGIKLSSEDLNDTNRLLEIIKSWGVERVAITDGKNGACLATEDKILRAPAFIAQQVDTTGAGDAFGSGLLAGYLITQEWGEALKYAILNSSGTVSDYGAQNGILTRVQVEAKMGEVEIEKIR